MTHYICTGSCNGVSPVAGTCQAESCEKYNADLTPCDCTEEAHAVSAENSSEE